MNKPFLRRARIVALFFAAASLATGATPEELTPSDWASLRAAYDAARHQFFAREDGTHAAQNTGQQWITTFDGRGFSAEPQDGAWQWGLELESLAVGAWRTSVAGKARGEIDGNRLSFARGDLLEEWFVNDARGLEQGWTISRRPSGAGDGALTLALSVRGGLSPDVSVESVRFLDPAGNEVVTYGGLKAWDADGRVLPSKFVTAPGGFSVEVDERGARYPIVIDPLAQAAYIKASNTGSGDAFGTSIAVSGDTVVIGAPFEDSVATTVNGNQANDNLMDSGAAYVFVRSGTQWYQQAYLKASNAGESDEFGDAVAISGNTIVVGAYRENSNAQGINGNQTNDTANDAGAAYVFVRNGWVWTQQAYLKGSDTVEGDYFGNSVSISGNTILIGAVNEESDFNGTNATPADQANLNAPGAGAVYVFTRTLTTWTQQAYLKASNSGSSDNFGASVSISGDTAVVGAYGEDSNQTTVSSNPSEPGNDDGSDTGAAYVFVRNGTLWNQEAYLKSFNADNSDRFGTAVSISGDTIVAGALWEDSDADVIDGDQGDNNATESGAAYVFVRTGTQWSQQAYLKASNSNLDDWFGRRVAISGHTIVVGAHNEDSQSIGNPADNTASNSGAAYVFTRTGTEWEQQAYIKGANTEQGDQFGFAVAVSGDLVFVGAPGEDGGSNGVNGATEATTIGQSGASYLFTGTSSVFNSLSKSGTSAPGALDVAFGVPGYIAVSDANTTTMFETALTGSGAPRGRERAVFTEGNGQVDLVLQKGDTLGSLGKGFATGQIAAVLSNPSINQSTLGGIFQLTASGTGISSFNHRAVLRDNGAHVSLLLRSGHSPQGFGAAQPISFSEILQSFDTDLITVPLSLRVGVGGVTLANDTAILPIAHDGTILAPTPVREGASGSIFSPLTAADTLGQFSGRAGAGQSEQIVFAASVIPAQIPTPQPAIPHLLWVNKEATGGAVLAKQGSTANGTGGAKFGTFPGFTQNGMGFFYRATLQGPPLTENEGLWLNNDLVLQKGKVFDVANYPGIFVTRILRFWTAGGNQQVILATIGGTGVTKANNVALLLRQSTGEFLTLLRTGDIAPGCLLNTIKVGTIQSVDVDPINGHYAILGSLVSAPATANQALWAGKTSAGDDTAANRQLRRPTLRLRKGDAYATEVTSRDIVRSISLKSFPDPTGAGGRGLGQAINRRGLIAVTITGDRRVQELITIQP